MSASRNVSVALAITLATGVGWSQHRVRPAPPGSVTLYRDVWGVPHVYAEREEDGFWGIGYTTAEDHLEGLLLRYLALKGELASAFGAGPVAEETGLRATALPGRAIPDAVASDLEARRWRHLADARRNFPKLPEQVQRNLTAYLNGIQRFMAEHPERVPRWAPALEPALPLAISSLFMLASSVTTCQAAIAGLPTGGGGGGGDGAAGGSNVWALPASRMREDAAVYSSDSHGVTEDSYGTFLTPTRIKTGALDAWLLDVPGAVMGLKGHSRHYAWGWAEGPRRPADCVVFETVPGKPRTYLYDGAPVEMTVEPYVIAVAGGDSVRGEFEYTSHNGVRAPVVHRSGSKAFAVSSSYLGRAGFAHVQFRDMLLATGEAEMEKALAATEIYPANLVYAGSDGSINYIRPGRIPIRPVGYDGSKPVDGNTSAGAWIGVRALKELLRVKNPAQGYLTNSNVSPDMMFGEPVFKAGDYPADFAFQPGLTGARQLRSIQLLEGTRVFSFEDAIDVVGDAFVVNTDRWGPAIRQVMKDGPARPAADSGYRGYLDTLTAFDGHFVAPSRGALYHALVRFRLRAGDRATAAAIESSINAGKALTAAQRETVARVVDSAYADLEKRPAAKRTFGDAFRIGRGGVSEPSRGFTLGTIGGDRATDLASFWAASYTPPDSAGTRWSLGGTRHAFLVQLGPRVRSVSLAVYGASDDPKSPHYSNQSRLVARGRLHSNFFEPDELADSVITSRTVATR
ncbi:MAG: penicillin acylase family protein [Gemmatimonadales bacterium]